MSVSIIYTEMWANLLWMCVYLYIHELSMNVCIIKKMCVYLYIHAHTPSPCSPWMCVCVCVCMCVYVCVMSKSVCIIYTEMWTNSVWMCVYLNIHVDLPSTCSLCARETGAGIRKKRKKKGISYRKLEMKMTNTLLILSLGCAKIGKFRSP